MDNNFWDTKTPMPQFMDNNFWEHIAKTPKPLIQPAVPSGLMIHRKFRWIASLWGPSGSFKDFVKVGARPRNPDGGMDDLTLIFFDTEPISDPKMIELVLCDGCGQPLEQWLMWVNVQKYTPGELDVSSSEDKTWEMQLKAKVLEYKSIIDEQMGIYQCTFEASFPNGLKIDPVTIRAKTPENKYNFGWTLTTPFLPNYLHDEMRPELKQLEAIVMDAYASKHINRSGYKSKVNDGGGIVWPKPDQPKGTVTLTRKRAFEETAWVLKDCCLESFLFDNYRIEAVWGSKECEVKNGK